MIKILTVYWNSILATYISISAICGTRGLNMNSTASRHVTPCNLVEKHKRFVGECCFNPILKMEAVGFSKTWAVNNSLQSVTSQKIALYLHYQYV
jgi:hypothetical protein